MFRHKSWTRLSVGVLGGLLAGTVAAGDETHARAEADIEELDARLTAEEGGWSLKVRYEVDIEHGHHGEPFTLLMQMRDDGRLIRDATGEPLTIGLPLDQPLHCDDGACTFADAVEFDLPRFAVHESDDLELTAFVTPQGRDEVLDDETTDVDVADDCIPSPTVIRTERSTSLNYEHVEPAPRVIIDRSAPTVIVRDRPQPIVIQHPRPIVIRESRPIIVRNSRTTIISRRGSGEPHRVPIRNNRGGVQVKVNW